jgi:hypothetical protein
VTRSIDGWRPLCCGHDRTSTVRVRDSAARSSSDVAARTRFVVRFPRYSPLRVLATACAAGLACCAHSGNGSSRGLCDDPAGRTLQIDRITPVPVGDDGAGHRPDCCRPACCGQSACGNPAQPSRVWSGWLRSSGCFGRGACQDDRGECAAPCELAQGKAEVLDHAVRRDHERGGAATRVPHRMPNGRRYLGECAPACASGGGTAFPGTGQGTAVENRDGARPWHLCSSRPSPSCSPALASTACSSIRWCSLQRAGSIGDR